MAIVELPLELRTEKSTCAICQVKLLWPKATAGMFDANNRQAFACVSHFMEVDLLLRGWADFIARERRKYNQQKQAASIEVYEGWQDARPHS